jgi:hypothetical protein
VGHPTLVIRCGPLAAFIRGPLDRDTTRTLGKALDLPSTARPSCVCCNDASCRLLGTGSPASTGFPQSILSAI